MKIAYLLHLNEASADSGVYKKVLSQIKYWSMYGNEVRVFQITEKNLLIENEYAIWRAFKYSSLSNYDRLIKAWYLVADEVANWSPDVVYLRFDIFSPAFIKIAKKIPIVVEVNTDDFKEYCLKHDFRCFYNLLTRKFLFENASGIAFVSKEISEKSYFKIFNKPYAVIGNGIDLSLYSSTPPPNNVGFNLVFIGSEGYAWHGADKIVKLAQIKSEWQFHLIGTKKDFGLPNVKAYGTLSREQYEPIMVRSDVAIGSLALHRIGINEISTLKVREYLAYGLPVIVGYKDTDFPDKVPFILELPNCENNVVEYIVEIESFLNYWKGKRVLRNEILHINWRVKEMERLRFLREIIENKTFECRRIG